MDESLTPERREILRLRGQVLALQQIAYITLSAAKLTVPGILHTSLEALDVSLDDLKTETEREIVLDSGNELLTRMRKLFVA